MRLGYTYVLNILMNGWKLSNENRFTFSSYQTNTTRETLETILNIQPKDSGGGSGETRESIVMRQSQDMLSTLPDDYIPHEVQFFEATL